MSNFMFGISNSDRSLSYTTSLTEKISAQLFSKDERTLNNNLRATHTYLGQMLSHELVSPTKGGGRKAKASLDLDSLYGNIKDARLYFDEHGLFITGSDSQGTPDSDLLRVPNLGTAIIPEPRNDENLLISQMHLFWQRVHNKIATQMRAANPKYNKTQIISDTRQYVIYLFHRVIVEDFLKKLLNRKVYEEYFDDRQQYFLTQGANDTVPLEFSMACFRLGHSMVRPSYELRPGRGAKKLKDLLRHVSGSKIEKRDVVKWSHLAKQKAKRIDHFLTNAMQNIPPPPGSQSCMSHTQIVEANLAAGIKAKIPSPEGVIDQLNRTHKPLAEKLGLNRETYLAVYENLEGFRVEDFPGSKLPMWLYVLFEAKTLGGNGNRLGPLASLVVAETLSYCIRAVANNWFTHSHDAFPLIAKDFKSQQPLTFEKIDSWL